MGSSNTHYLFFFVPSRCSFCERCFLAVNAQEKVNKNKKEGHVRSSGACVCVCVRVCCTTQERENCRRARNTWPAGYAHTHTHTLYKTNREGKHVLQNTSSYSWRSTKKDQKKKKREEKRCQTTTNPPRHGGASTTTFNKLPPFHGGGGGVELHVASAALLRAARMHMQTNTSDQQYKRAKKL
jgi:hypothetical protein